MQWSIEQLRLPYYQHKDPATVMATEMSLAESIKYPKIH